ncbi:hypothetical protein G6F56_007661 [Rhizopus delemar]|nr:hypothetical protein G6F56_007661 [Rhizopus delemar]
MLFSTKYQCMPLPPVPRTNKFQSLASHSEMYLIITEVECSSLQERLKTAMDKIVLDWTERHDSFVDAIDKLECSKHSIEHQNYIQSQRYEKSLKEVQLYRARYNHILHQRMSQTSTKSYSNFSILSEPSSLMSSPLIEENMSSALFFRSDDEDECAFDLSSVISNPTSTISSAPLSPLSPLSPSSPSSPLSPLIYSKMDLLLHSAIKSECEEYEHKEFERKETENKESEQEILKFACSDGFWNAIALGKSNKTEIDVLVRYVFLEVTIPPKKINSCYFRLSNFLRRGGSPNVAKNSKTHKNVKEGYSLVHALVATKNTASLQLVLQAGANPNVFPLTKNEQDKITPLVLAAKVGHMNSIRLLIELANAHLYDSKGPRGENALHAAIQSGSDEIVGYLLRASQNLLLETPDFVGATPLHYAAMEGRTRSITLIVKECSVKLDVQDNKGETPLHYAVRNRRLKAVAKLIELGAYPNSYIPKQVPTPLDLAKAGGLEAIVYHLKQFGAKTTKEMGRKSSAVTSCSSNSSTFSGESSGSSDRSTSGRSIKQYLQMKTSRIMKGK